MLGACRSLCRWRVTSVLSVAVAWAGVAMQSVLNAALRLIPDLTDVVAPEQHKERADELVGLLFPLLYEVFLNFARLVLHLVDLILQTELLLFEERNVELFGGVASLQIPAAVQIIVFHYSGYNS